MELSSPNYQQLWVQEVDLDLSKVDDIVVTKDKREIYWVMLIFTGNYAKFYDIENGQRKLVGPQTQYERGFSTKEEAYKVQKYMKQLAKLCGAKLLQL